MSPCFCDFRVVTGVELGSLGGLREGLGVPIFQLQQLGERPVGLKPVRRPGDGVPQAVFDARWVVRRREQGRQIIPGVFSILGCARGCDSGFEGLLTGHQAGSEQRGTDGELLHSARIAQVGSGAGGLPSQNGTVGLGRASGVAGFYAAIGKGESGVGHQQPDCEHGEDNRGCEGEGWVPAGAARRLVGRCGSG